MSLVLLNPFIKFPPTVVGGTGGVIIGGYKGNGVDSDDNFGSFLYILPTTTEADHQTPAPIATTYQNLHCRATTNTSDASFFRLRIGGVNGNLAVTIPALTTGVFGDTINSDTVSQGDLLGLMYDFVSTGSTAIRGVGIENTGNATFGGNWRNNGAKSADAFVGLGGTFIGVPEGTRQGPAPDGMTLANAHCNITVNSRDAAVQCRLRVTTVSVNTNITIPASTTGVFGDTSNTDAVNQGDLINYLLDFAGGTGSTTMKGNMIERSV